MNERIAFLEKVFLKRRKHTGALRGVELFNLNLIRELDACGRGVTLVAEASWRDSIEKELADSLHTERLYVKAPIQMLGGLAAAAALRRKAAAEGPFAHLILGNVANNLIPALAWLRSRKCFSSMVLIAHRETSPRFLRAVSRIPGHIVCVCEPIAVPFRKAGVRASVHVDYGILNADRFHPAETKAAGPVRFCVLGALDNAWKGADTAIEAFRLLPEDVRSVCELHLLAYSTPPSFPKEPNIVPYGWCDASEVPEFLRKMDVLLVPSRDEEVMRETFSQATVQGMLSCLPVVFAPLPILTEKFDRGGGLPAATPAEFADAMKRLSQDPALRQSLGAEARATALERYVWDTKRFTDRYLSDPS